MPSGSCRLRARRSRRSTRTTAPRRATRRRCTSSTTTTPSTSRSTARSRTRPISPAPHPARPRRRGGRRPVRSRDARGPQELLRVLRERLRHARRRHPLQRHRLLAPTGTRTGRRARTSARSRVDRGVSYPAARPSLPVAPRCSRGTSRRADTSRGSRRTTTGRTSRAASPGRSRTTGGSTSSRGSRSKTPIELRPFLVGRVRRRDPARGPARERMGLHSRPAGLDLKWHPTPGLTLDATFNPDFAQVEADQVVLNLSTVETYYPEKRPFFLEGIDAFTTPFQLLYTRRIGRVPAHPRAPHRSRSTTSSSSTSPSLRRSTARRSSPGTLGKWSVGTVQAVTAENDVQVRARVTGNTRQRDASRQPDVDVRASCALKRDLGDNANIGVMGTAVTHAEPTETYPLAAAGDQGSRTTTELCPEPGGAHAARSRRTVAARAARALLQRRVRRRGRLALALAGGGLRDGGAGRRRPCSRTDRCARGRRDEITRATSAVGTQAYINKEGGKHWIGDMNADRRVARSSRSTTRATTTRANRSRGARTVEHRELDPCGAVPARRTHSSTCGDDVRRGTGYSIGQGLYLGGVRPLQELLELTTIDVHYSRDEVRRPRSGRRHGAPARRARSATEVSFCDRLDASAFVSASTRSATSISDGFNMSGNASVSVRLPAAVGSRLPPDVAVDVRRAALHRRVRRTSGQYLFGKLDAKSVGLTLRTTYTFAPAAHAAGRTRSSSSRRGTTRPSRSTSRIRPAPRPAIQLARPHAVQRRRSRRTRTSSKGCST